MNQANASSPLLTIVVVIFDMRREAPRTLYTLSAEYQQGVTASDYEVVVVENGSSSPLSHTEIAAFGENFSYLEIRNASPSPAAALNLAASRVDTPFLGLMIDGARMVTPGVVRQALEALTHFERPIVGTVAFHIGPDSQTVSIPQGYTRAIEDALLARIDWRNNGYRLFDISTLASSSARGWLGTISESNLLFLTRALFDELGGFDERFDLPGGGLVNIDFYRRACALPDSVLITMFGEASFHQMHGGVMSNRPAKGSATEMDAYLAQYEAIHGVGYERSRRKPMLMGFARPEVVPSLYSNCREVLRPRSFLFSRRLRRQTRRVVAPLRIRARSWAGGRGASSTQATRSRRP